MDEDNTKIPNIVIPRYSPSNPPKHYNKNKAISIFCCLWFSFGFKCPELLRSTVTRNGDIYVIPFVEYSLGDFHLSYHKFGKFHWGKDRTHIQPAYREMDFTAAFGLWLKLKQPPCFCFRKGKNLNSKEIVSLLQKLAENFPFAVNIEEISEVLKGARHIRMVVPELHSTEKVARNRV